MKITKSKGLKLYSLSPDALKVAEEVGFEPTDAFPRLRISSAVP